MPKKKAAVKLPKPKQKRRAKGTGSIFPDKRRGGYLARVPVGKLPNGKTRYKEVRGETQKEVIEKMKGVAPPDPNTVTTQEWATRRLAGISVKSSTYDGYKRQIDSRIVPQLGAVRLVDLNVSGIRAALAVWAKAGTATANRTLRVGATMLNAAKLDGLVTGNPFATCPKLKHKAKPLDPFSPAELRRLVAAHGERYAVAPIVALIAATGLRIGEAAALDVGDYDPQTGALSVTKTWSRDHGMRDPKSVHSVRTITVPEPARVAVLRARGDRTSGPLFPNAADTRFDSAQMHLGLNRLLKRLGMGDRQRNPHALRHGVATLLVSRGVPLGDVARFLGHTVAQVVRVYVHAAGTNPADTLNDVLRA